MDPNVPRENSWPDEPDTYWRRRVIALAAGLGVVGLLAWACSGAFGGGSPVRQATVGATATAQPAAEAAGTPTAGTSMTPTSAPTVTITATPTSSGRGGAHPSESAPAAVPGHQPRGRCVPADVVPSLSVSQQKYQRRVKPQFSIYLVNVGQSNCSLDVGARSLRVVIKSGQVRVWGSADCAHGTTSDVVRLRRGVPFVTYLSWNRRGSSPGCRAARPNAAPGTYTAMVISGAVHSPAEVFVLR